ncbi:hypothetical protein [Kribbella lupini]|uniref:Uncharacterized protein n=1 Tax=Kribbella lupini TaxID=291602 RepID=A0ABP4L279_9ACTN
MNALIWSPLNPLLGALSFLPVWVRPWTLAVIALALVWFLFFRSGWRFLAVMVGRAAFGVVLLVLTVPLAIEYVSTRRRRLKTEKPSHLATGVSEVAERFCFSLSGVDKRLAGVKYSARKWPKKSFAVLCAAGVGSWVLFSAAPALAVPSAVGGQAYGLWRQVEAWAHVNPERMTDLTPDPVPVLQVRGNGVYLTTSKDHAGDQAVVWLADGGKPLGKVKLDKNGSAKLAVISALNKGSFARGRVFRLEVGRSLVFVRLV